MRAARRYVQRFLASYHRYHDIFSDTQTESYNIAALVNVQPIGTYFVRLVPPTTTGSNVVVSPQTLYPFPSTSFTNRSSGSYQGTITQTHGALVFGYEFERQAGIISGTDVDRTNNGFFAQEQYSLTKRIFLTGGLRFEHSSTYRPGSRAARSCYVPASDRNISARQRLARNSRAGALR